MQMLLNPFEARILFISLSQYKVCPFYLMVPVFISRLIVPLVILHAFYYQLLLLYIQVCTCVLYLVLRYFVPGNKLLITCLPWCALHPLACCSYMYMDAGSALCVYCTQWMIILLIYCVIRCVTSIPIHVW